MSKLTKRITAILLAGMLVIGSVPGSVFAASTDVDPGQTSEIAEEVYEEEISEVPEGAGKTTQVEEISEAPVTAGETSETAEEVFTEDTSEASTAAGESYPEEASTEEEIQYYTVTLEANGGYFENEWDDAIGEAVEQAEMVEKHIPVDGTVAAFPVYKTESESQTMIFAGWSLERNGELVSQAEEAFIPVDNCILYAVWRAEDIALGETEEHEVADEGIEQTDPAQETEGADSAAGDTIVAEEGAVEEDAAFEANTDSEIENDQDIVLDQEAIISEEDVENISEESSEAAVEEEEPIVDSGTCGNNVNWILSGQESDLTLTISGSGPMNDFLETNIPWASRRAKIKSLVVEDGVTKIGDYAFYSLNKLVNVSIASTVKSIGKYTFKNCVSLTNIQLPVNVTSIGDWVFYGCSGLTSVTIPYTMTSFGMGAFWECSNLESIKIPGLQTSLIGTFYGCKSLTSITIPSNVMNIGGHAFFGCSSLTSVTIEGGSSTIGEEAFSGCSNLISINIPNTVNSIGERAFLGCSSLTNINIPYNVKSIGSEVFSGCSSLTSANIPNSVKSIGLKAFYNCSNLASVKIPGSVTYIGTNAFSGCSNNLDIYIEYLNSWMELDRSSIGLSGNWYINGELLTDLVMTGSATSIRNYAYSGCTSLTSATIPDSVTSIGNSAFSGCSNLSNVTIPGSVTSIGDKAFSNCSSLLSVTIPDSVTSIGNSAFSGCSSLMSVTIPDSVTSIDENIFSNCSNLESVTIPDSVTSIGNSAFSNCSNLQKVTIPDSVTSIGNSAFSGCSNLTSVTIPASVTSIGRSAFRNCGSDNSGIIINYRGTEAQWQKVGSAIGSINHIFYNYFSVDATFQLSDTTFIYTGKQIKPAVIVSYNGDFLIEDIDYDLKYENNLDVGIATIKINGIGNYSGTAEKTFTITTASVSNAVIKDISAKTYNGKAQIQNPIVIVDEVTLKYEKDYSLLYKNNTNAGTASITITGKGNYSGTKSTSFIINKAAQSITAYNLSLTFPNFNYINATGNQGKLTYKSSNSAIATVDSVGKVTAKGAGTAKITITAAATSNYNAATKTITVNIAKAAQSITAKAGASSVVVGKTTTVSLTGNKGSKSFKSSDTSIATVTSAGKVTAKKVGTVKITATSAATANYNAASKTVTIKVVPAATASLAAANQVKGIKLTWKKVTGANGYKVYRGSTLIKTITSGSTVTYADTAANTNGTKYTYKVVAKATTGDSTLSKSVAVYRVARPAISSATNSAASKMTVKWGKNAKANGYQIQYSLSSSFASGNKAVTITSASTVSRVIGSLTKGKTYYVRIRTYKTVGSTKYWSEWSAKKSVKISK